MGDACINVRCCDLQVCVGGASILTGVSFSCCRGEWLVLTGPSGAGKTTLLRTINGLCPPSAGQVWALGSWMPGRSRRQAQGVWRRTGTVMQDAALFETHRASTNVELALQAAGAPRREARRQAGDWLDRFGLGDKRDAYPPSLSGGEKQRVALARALAPRPQLLILDEPTSHLDDGSARIVISAIRDLVEEGATVVMSSHHEAQVAGDQTCRITLESGKVASICR